LVEGKYEWEERRGGKRGWYSDLVELISDEFIHFFKKGGTHVYKILSKLNRNKQNFTRFTCMTVLPLGKVHSALLAFFFSPLGSTNQ